MTEKKVDEQRENHYNIQKEPGGSNPASARPFPAQSLPFEHDHGSSAEHKRGHEVSLLSRSEDKKKGQLK